MLVLDSDTISYYFRGQPDVVQQWQACAPSDLGVPAIVAYELRYGLLRLPAASHGPRLEALDKLLRPMQSLAFDAACAEQAARVRSMLKRAGRPIDPHDVLLAATALRHQAPLVTRNLSEFSRVDGLQLVNWHPA